MTIRRNESGTAWSELARLDPLAAVLDPGDRDGAKNRLIDRIHRHALGRAAGDLAGIRALDFACGTGRLARWLVSRGASVTGVDATAEMVDVARRLVPEAEFVVGGDGRLPFADEAFDVVVTAYALQYYLDGAGGLQRELARVLAPGGRVLAVEQVTDDPSALGRGGPVAGYAAVFEVAGFVGVQGTAIRLGDSRIVGAVQYRPRLLCLPGLAQLAAAEARRSAEPLVGGRYADVLFVASRG